MKDAAGEANMTVITILLIGVIAAVATPLVNNAMNSTAKRAVCQEMGGTLEKDICTYYKNGEEATCTVSKDKDGNYSCN